MIITDDSERIDRGNYIEFILQRLEIAKLAFEIGLTNRQTSKIWVFIVFVQMIQKKKPSFSVEFRFFRHL
jgi:hypothetical protein